MIPTPAKPNLKPRLKSLDVLRGIAILLVLGVHTNSYDIAPNPYAAAFYETWRSIGQCGVDLFFVLSGFLVSSLLLSELKKTGKVNIKRFFVRRGMKIYPAFYIMIAFTVIRDRLKGTPTETKHLFAELFFLQNYLGGLWAHTWSLAIEEHFYIILGLLVVFISFIGQIRKAPQHRYFVPIIAAVAITCLTARIVVTALVPFDVFSHAYYTHLRIDSLFAGVALGYANTFHRERSLAFVNKHFRALVVLMIACLMPLFFFKINRDPYFTSVGFTFLYIGFATLIALTAMRKPNETGTVPAVFEPLAFFGFYSYSIYLWHWPFKHLVYKALTVLHWSEASMYYWGAPIYMICALLGGVALSKIIEVPVLKIRDRYFP